MFALIGALFGFLSSGLPSVLDYFHAVKDNKHELDLMSMQIEFQKLKLGEEIKEAAIGANLAQMQMAYRVDSISSGIKWIDGLNKLIKPILVFSFLGIYLSTRIPLIYIMMTTGELTIAANLFTDHDYSILGSIIGYFFGTQVIGRV